MEWLKEKYGADRIISATLHKDETSPHLSVFVVPLTKDGRLSAKDFLGGREVLRQDQTNYHEKVVHLGLKRGVEGSKTSHKSIRQYYTTTKQLKEVVDTAKAKMADELKQRQAEIQNMSLKRAIDIVKAEQERRAKTKSQGQER